MNQVTSSSPHRIRDSSSLSEHDNAGDQCPNQPDHMDQTANEDAGLSHFGQLVGELP